MAQIETSPLKWTSAKKNMLLLEKEEQWHFLLLLAIGFYSGYRLDDIRHLKYSDFEGEELNISERKTTKQRAVPIIGEFRRIVKLCQEKLNRPDDHYLIVRSRFRINKPLGKHSVIERLKSALRYCGIEDKKIGMHTLRKTFALRYFEILKSDVGEQRALIALRKQLNHTDVNTTRRYIGLAQSTQRDVFENFA